MGSGQIVEEASSTGTYVAPAIQLLEYDNHPGVYAICFCYYSLDGRFQRSPMLLDGPDSLEGMRAALNRRSAPARLAQEARQLTLMDIKEPANLGPVPTAAFDATCSNLTHRPASLDSDRSAAQ